MPDLRFAAVCTGAHYIYVCAYIYDIDMSLVHSCVFNIVAGLNAEPKGVWLCPICVLLPDGQVLIMSVYVLVCMCMVYMYIYTCVHSFIKQLGPVSLQNRKASGYARFRVRVNPIYIYIYI